MANIHLQGIYEVSGGNTFTITNAHQLLINSLNENAYTGAQLTITNRWGIYQDGASDSNYFAGVMQLGSTTSTGEQLQVTGNGIINGDLFIRGSLNTFSAANRGIIALNGTSDNIIAFSNNTTDYGYIYVTSTKIEIQATPAASTIQFRTAATERMRISATGNIGINTTTTTGLVTALVGSEFFFIGFGANNENYYTSGTNGIQVFRRGTVEMARFTTASNLLIGTTTDSGYKTQISGAASLLELVSSTNSAEIRFRNSVNTNGFIVYNNENLLFFANSGATSMVNFFGSTNSIGVLTGTAPTASQTDRFLLYSADITAGNAAAHFRTEGGAVVKIYQQTTAVGTAARVGGGGTNVTDTDTFGGYTLGQIVQALQNAGFLA
jgi:hypothetical protein